jgi:hypothetical protein
VLFVPHHFDLVSASEFFLPLFDFFFRSRSGLGFVLQLAILLVSSPFLGPGFRFSPPMTRFRSRHCRFSFLFLRPGLGSVPRVAAAAADMSGSLLLGPTRLRAESTSRRSASFSIRTLPFSSAAARRSRSCCGALGFELGFCRHHRPRGVISPAIGSRAGFVLGRSGLSRSRAGLRVKDFTFAAVFVLLPELFSLATAGQISYAGVVRFGRPSSSLLSYDRGLASGFDFHRRCRSSFPRSGFSHRRPRLVLPMCLSRETSSPRWRLVLVDFLAPVKLPKAVTRDDNLSTGT